MVRKKEGEQRRESSYLPAHFIKVSSRRRFPTLLKSFLLFFLDWRIERIGRCKYARLPSLNSLFIFEGRTIFFFLFLSFSLINLESQNWNSDIPYLEANIIFFIIDQISFLHTRLHILFLFFFPSLLSLSLSVTLSLSLPISALKCTTIMQLLKPKSKLLTLAGGLILLPLLI